MNNKEILEKIFSNYKRIVAYYPYKTGGSGTDNVIAETDNFNGGKYDEPLKNFVNLTVQLGAAAAGCGGPDNKTAVELKVDGIDFPVYCYRYDGKYCITKKIDSESEGKKILWNIEY